MSRKFAIAILSSFCSAALAEGPPDDVQTLRPVTVEGTQLPSALPEPQQSLNTVTHITAEGLKVLGGPAQNNPWTALRNAPSINLQSADAYGLGRPTSMRLRGKSATHIGRTIEGLPIAGEPGFANGKGGADLIDLENLEGVTLMRGAVPADRGLGFSNSGVVDSQIRWPDRAFGAKASQSFGSDQFRRTFARVDSGELSVPLRFFISMSDAHADKWRGPGDQARHNLAAGFSLDFSSRVSAELLAVRHKVRWHNYRALSYKDAQDSAMHKRIEYNDALTGNPAQDVNYYGFNKQDYTNHAVLGKLRVVTGEGSQLLFKPYYWKEKGFALSGSPNARGAPGVTHWEIKHDTYGFDLRHESQHNWGGLTAGYWYQSSEAPPPPTAQRLYRVQPDGSLVFDQWSTLAKTTRHQFHNPYVNLTWRTQTVEVQAGLRYMQYKDPSFTYYKGDTAPDVGYGSVFDHNPVPDPGMYSKGRTYRSWLPNAGITWNAAPNLAFSANYGRTYGRQNWGSVAGAYTNSREVFDAAGISFNDLWNGLRPEQSDNIDAGVRIDFPMGHMGMTLYQTRYKHKQLSLYDEALDVAYHQSVARATARGVELELGLTPVSDISVYMSYSFNRASYDENARTGGNKVVNVKGKQMQDSPRHMAKLTTLWQPGNWSLMASMTHIDSRFGDTEETQKIPSHTLFDAGVGYDFGNVLGLSSLSANLSVNNLFDKRYIGIINTSDYAVGGQPSYLPGPRRTAIFQLSGRF